MPWEIDDDLPAEQPDDKVKKKTAKPIRFNVSDEKKIQVREQAEPDCEFPVKGRIFEDVFSIDDISIKDQIVAEQPKPKIHIVPAMNLEGSALRQQYIDDGYRIISQSFIKRVLKEGSEIPFCPNKLYHTTILGSKKEEPSDAMKAGNLGESLILGFGRDGECTETLGRKRVSKKAIEAAKKEGKPEPEGELYIDEIRVRMQADRAKVIFNNYRMTLPDGSLAIIPGVNIQPKIFKVIDEKDKILLETNPDIFPVPIFYEGKQWTAIVDVKFTGNVNTKFGDFCWGAPEFMDHTQAEVYLHATDDINYVYNPHLKEAFGKRENFVNKLFLYMVFDYQVPEEQLDFKPVDVKWTMERKKNIMARINHSVAIYEHCEASGWPIRTDYENAYQECKKCPLNYLKEGGTCQFAKTTQSV